MMPVSSKTALNIVILNRLLGDAAQGSCFPLPLILLIASMFLGQYLSVKLTYCTRFVWQGFNNRGATGVPSLRSFSCLTEPMPASSKVDLAEPISDGGVGLVCFHSAVLQHWMIDLNFCCLCKWANMDYNCFQEFLSSLQINEVVIAYCNLKVKNIVAVLPLLWSSYIHIQLCVSMLDKKLLGKTLKWNLFRIITSAVEML